MIGVITAITLGFAAVSDGDKDVSNTISWRRVKPGSYLGTLPGYVEVPDVCPPWQDVEWIFAYGSRRVPYLGIWKDSKEKWTWNAAPFHWGRTHLDASGETPTLSRAKHLAEITAPILADVDATWQKHERDNAFEKMLDEYSYRWAEANDGASELTSHTGEFRRVVGLVFSQESRHVFHGDDCNAYASFPFRVFPPGEHPINGEAASREDALHVVEILAAALHDGVAL